MNNLRTIVNFNIGENININDKLFPNISGIIIGKYNSHYTSSQLTCVGMKSYCDRSFKIDKEYKIDLNRPGSRYILSEDFLNYDYCIWVYNNTLCSKIDALIIYKNIFCAECNIPLMHTKNIICSFCNFEKTL